MLPRAVNTRVHLAARLGAIPEPVRGFPADKTVKPARGMALGDPVADTPDMFIAKRNAQRGKRPGRRVVERDEDLFALLDR